jgi:hypothetical protein
MPPRPAGSRRSKKCCAEFVAAVAATGVAAVPGNRGKWLVVVVQPHAEGFDGLRVVITMTGFFAYFSVR